MDNAIYVGLSRQMTLQRQLDVAASNMANMDTAGFKVEHLRVVTDPETAPHASAGFGRAAIKYALDNGVGRDFSEGALEHTGAVFDVALDGAAGFFSVQTPQGVQYTRDGRFGTNAQNQIVDHDGNTVLDNSGGAISVDPTKAAPVIGKDGTVSQQDATGHLNVIGRIGVTRFDNRGALSKEGGNRFSDSSGQAGAQTARDVTMDQGFVEKSNVNAVVEVTSLIDITRAYERVQNLITSTQDLSTKAIDALGKMN
ncbi:flagellar hook-basal body complex protein [Caulobacter sp. S45]|uniref:flagellar hook-basal body complex protein n=1 Tax=Caulobacter sp. S45 TaxID=1641861 RepID=UPI00131CD47A|nr:flagellar hook-basal body complex protein [Caulobacter sp. S45]